jgi:predicted 3-demethylubiquinone-9 3-methyltransferase (glyoxalase superfamily)
MAYKIKSKKLKEKKIREKLIYNLALKWRKAENYYLETESDSEKWKVKEYQDKLKLNSDEEQYLYDILNSMGV